ncbi:uncharacterized protein LOC101863713 [Aplysia californica]|uniref:Uncharacterized protein LOC101863713 n=1 Tax=Aplysia californica TaxID=6500 RepID=A0ABM1AE97_APLCA|nr:uncharacterized protein LOC101863713 [Aplysia californica]
MTRTPTLLALCTVFSSTSTGDESSAWFHSSVSELSPCLDGTSDANNNNVDDDFDDNDDVFADVCHDDVSNYQHLVNQSRHIIAGAATTVAAAAAATGGGGSGNGDQLSLLSAARESVRCGRLTPLLKVELKYLIQARRMSEGKDEMEVSFEPRADAQLSASELERVERRRRQNRAAAKKFREKRKSTEESLLKNIQELQETNSRLVEQAKQLRHEKQLLMEIVAEHLLVCPHLGQLPVDIIGGDSVP